MIVRLTLTDFLAHGHSVIEFGPGLTVLTGPNNTGKSAVVEALRCLCQNPTPKHFIRHGAKEARVEAEMSDGTRVLWIRTKTHARYELTRPGQEPETYAKFGRKPPSDVLDVLRLDPVELETDEPIDVHIGNQRDPIFLLNRSGFTTASFLASSTESAHLLSMQRLLKDRIQAAKREEQGLSGRLSVLETDLDRLAPLPDLGLALDRAREAEAGVLALDGAIPALDRDLGRLSRLGSALAALGLRQEACRTLSPAPRTEDCRPLARTLKTLAGLRDQAATLSVRLARLAATPPPAAWPTALLGDCLARVSRLSRLLDRTEARGQALAGLRPLPQVQDTTALATLVRALGQVRIRLAAPAARLKILAPLAGPQAPVEIGPLARLLARLRDLRGQAFSLEADLDQKARTLAQAEARMTARLAELGRCPLCGSGLDARTFFTRGADHDH